MMPSLLPLSRHSRPANLPLPPCWHPGAGERPAANRLAAEQGARLPVLVALVHNLLVDLGELRRRVLQLLVALPDVALALRVVGRRLGPVAGPGGHLLQSSHAPGQAAVGPQAACRPARPASPASGAWRARTQTPGRPAAWGALLVEPAAVASERASPPSPWPCGAGALTVHAITPALRVWTAAGRAGSLRAPGRPR